MNFDQGYSHVYICLLINYWTENKLTRYDPAWPSPAPRSDVYLRGYDTTNLATPIRTQSIFLRGQITQLRVSSLESSYNA